MSPFIKLPKLRLFLLVFFFPHRVLINDPSRLRFGSNLRLGNSPIEQRGPPLIREIQSTSVWQLFFFVVFLFRSRNHGSGSAASFNQRRLISIWAPSIVPSFSIPFFFFLLFFFLVPSAFHLRFPLANTVLFLSFSLVGRAYASEFLGPERVIIHQGVFA